MAQGKGREKKKKELGYNQEDELNYKMRLSFVLCIELYMRDKRI